MVALGLARRTGPRTAATVPQASPGAPPTVVANSSPFVSKSGFTLIELMLVVAIIGLLAAIALPRFANLVVKSKEASLRGKLGTMRSAVSIYYVDNEGRNPNFPGVSGLSTVLVPKYLNEIPRLSIPTVPAHTRASGLVTGISPATPDWVICGAPGVFCEYAYDLISGTGRLVIACTHTDSKGTTWSLW